MLLRSPSADHGDRSVTHLTGKRNVRKSHIPVAEKKIQTYFGEDKAGMSAESAQESGITGRGLSLVVLVSFSRAVSASLLERSRMCLCRALISE